MNRRRALLISVTFLIAACQNRSSDSSADRAAVTAAADQYQSSWLQSDTTMAFAILSDDVQLLLPGAPDIRGKAAASAFIAQQMTNFTVPSLNVNRDELVIRGDHAIDTGTFAEVVTDKNGKSMNTGGRYIIIWRREPSGWRLLRFFVNSPDSAETSHSRT